MKKCYLIFILIIITTYIGAHYVENMPFTLTQPDGSTIEVLVTGDEFYQRIFDQNGYTLLLNRETGYYVYAISDGDLVTESDYIAGKHDPATLGIPPNLYKADPIAENLRREQQAFIENNSRNLPIGAMTNVVGLVRFNDQTEFPVTPTYSDYNDMHNSLSQQSLKDFYLQNSDNQLTIDSYLYPLANASGHVVSLQADHDRDYYRPFSAANPDGWTSSQMMYSRFGALCVELVEKIEPHIPAGLNLDLNDDGINDALSFIFRGDVEPGNPILWPSSWGWAEPIGTINDCDITHLLCQFENNLNMAVLCHEMGHKIGIPDFYHGVNNGISPLGQWCIMDNSPNVPHLPTFTKWKYTGWFSNIPVINPTSTPTTYTLTAINQSPYSCYKIPSSNPDQYYMLEYRKQEGRYEIGVPGSGLIIYRVITSFNGQPVEGGNIAGPPDELYIYRPNGDVSNNGNLPFANFGSGGRTEIHNYTNPKPWLYVDDFTTPDGSLVITDIGPAVGNTISFSVRSTIPHYWTGSVSDDWANPGNWAQGTVPTISDDVEINTDQYQVPYPKIYPATPAAYCKSLKIGHYARLEIGSSLHIAEDLTCHNGDLAFIDQNASLQVYSDIIWKSGAQLHIGMNDATIYCHRDVIIQSHSTFSMYTGTIEFTGTGNSSLTINGGSVSLNNVSSNKTYPHVLSLSGIATTSVMIKGNFINYPGSHTNNLYNGNLIVKGNFLDYNSNSGIFWNNGTVIMGGENQTIYFASPNAQLANLQINSTGVVNLSCDLNLAGSMTINSGVFNANTHNIYIAGNWENNAGPESFNEGISRVIFNGTNDQYCNSIENFHILEVYKPAGYLKIDNTEAQVTCVSYDWTAGGIHVISGTFSASSLSDNRIKGTWKTNTGGVINIANVSGSVDLGGHLHIDGGTINVYGGTTPSWWPYGGEASITMTTGTLEFFDQGVLIYDPGHPFTSNITGGTIKVARNFIINRTDFHPSGGKIVLSGVLDANVSHWEGSYFHNLEILKGPDRNDENMMIPLEIDEVGNSREFTRSNTVYATSNLTINGWLGISSGIFVAPELIKIKGNWSNSVGASGFVPGTGLVKIEGTTNSYCYGETFNDLELNKGGYGELIIPNGSIVTSNSYNWTGGVLTVNGGTFTALDLIDPGIYGWINLNSGSIHYYQESTQYLDLRGTLNISGGELHLYGGMGDSWWPYLGYGALNMSAGLIDVHDNGIYIASGNTFITNITGGTIRTAKDFSCFRDDFTPAGGILEMYSSADANILMSAGSLRHVKINKLGRHDRDDSNIRESDRYDREGNVILENRSNTVKLLSNLTALGGLTIENGTFWLNGYEANFAMSVHTYATLLMNNPADKITAGIDFTWFGGANAQITQGILEGSANWFIYDGATVILPVTVTTILKSMQSRAIYIDSPNMQFGHLTIGGSTSGGGYTILNSSTHDLNVAGNLTITANNELDLNNRNLYVLGNLDLDGKLDIHSTTAMIQGKPDFATTSILSIDSGNFFYFHSAQPRTNYLRGTFNINSGNFEAWYNSLEIETGSINTMNNGTLKCNGINAVHPGTFQPIGGTVIFNTNLSGGNYNLDISNGNWLPNLVIDSSPTGFILNNDLIIKGSLTITSGNLDVSLSNYNISVGGNWNNNIGSAAFNERNGLVVFNGSSLQFFNTNEQFYNLTLNKTSFPYLLMANGVVISVNNNLNIDNGTLILAEDNHLITNNLTISSMAGLNTFYSNESYIVVNGNWIDNNSTCSNETGFFYDQSTVIFNGSGNQSIMRNSAPLEFNNLIIEKPASSYCFVNNPVKVYGFFELNGGLWHDTANFFDHHFYQNFTVNSNGGFNSNTQNTVSFKGSSDQMVTYNGSSGNFYNVVIDKTVNRALLMNDEEETILREHRLKSMLRIENEDYLRSQRVNLGSILPLMNGGNLTVESGILDTNSQDIICTGDLNINEDAVLQLDAGATLYMGNLKSLNVNNGGRLELLGGVGWPATITSFNGYYDFNIESGGTIASTNALFEYMTPNGLNIKNGSFVDPALPLLNSTFRNGSSGGTLLTINNNQTLDIGLAYFPTNNWSGLNNVTKTLNHGSVTFIQSYGEFSGETHENDPHNRISWSNVGFVDLQIVDAIWYDPAPELGELAFITVTVFNSGTMNISTTISLDFYYNRSTPPEPLLVGDLYLQIRSMPPGQLADYTFQVSNLDPGVWNSWIQIDTGQLIDESDETNNIYGPVPIYWAGLPMVTDLQIEFIPATNAIELNWTYPIEVDNFNIYRSTNPYFTPSQNNLIIRPPSNLTEYSEPVSGPRYFYLVTAEILPIRTITNSIIDGD